MMSFDDKCLLEALPDTLAEAIDIVASMDEAERAKSPELEKIKDFAKHLINMIER